MAIKNKKNKRKEYYIHQIIRDESKDSSSIKSSPKKLNDDVLVGTTKCAPSYIESIGYHQDPSRYDHLRKNTNNDNSNNVKPYVVTKNDDTNELNSNNVVNNNELDSFYDGIDESYDSSNNEETSFGEVISIDELENNEQVNIVAPKKDVSSSNIVSNNNINNANTNLNNSNNNYNNQDIIIKKSSKPTIRRKYVVPPLELLTKGKGESEADVRLAEEQKKIIDNVISNYGIRAHVAKYIFGPTVIVYLIEYESLDEDVKSLRRAETNLSMYLASNNIRLLTPIPKMQYAGVEVPRPSDNRSIVYLYDLLIDKKFKNSKMVLPVAVGKNSFGENIYIDIYDMPHGLCAGATKSGKSVCLNCFIISMIYHCSPDDVRLILVDPKVVEFSKYSEIPHLATPVITDQDLFEPIVEWLVLEMERRYQILQKYDCVELVELNKYLEEKHEPKLPLLVMIMDEFNDWFQDASKQTELNITRLMQKARAAGIHIILATQSPRAETIKGSIKTNITTRLAFKVSSLADSTVILGQSCAEKLEGRGDMILRHNGMDDTRMQGALVTNSEVKNIVQHLRQNNDVDYILTTEELLQKASSRGENNGFGKTSTIDVDLLKEVAYYVVRNENASVNRLMKMYGMSFNKMDELFREMERLGIISGTQQGTKRKVLIDELQLEEILNNI